MHYNNQDTQKKISYPHHTTWSYRKGYYISEPEDSFGVAPDPVIVFQERYFAEHPEKIDDTPEGRKALLAYTDALGYYLRDIYNPFYIQEYEGQGEMPEKTEITEDTAVEYLRGYMTEVLGWDPEAVNSMTPNVQWDEQYRLWVVSGEVSAASIAKMGRCENVTTDVLLRICEALNCRIEDIMERVPASTTPSEETVDNYT